MSIIRVDFSLSIFLILWSENLPLLFMKGMHKMSNWTCANNGQRGESVYVVIWWMVWRDVLSV